MPGVLVTGASGFVGRHLIEALTASGYSPIGTALRPGPGTNQLRCDLTDPAEVASVVQAVDPDIVVHCAAISTVTMPSTLEYYRVNLIGTENILKSIAQKGRRTRFIFLSTAGVYGNHDRDFLSEETCPAPVHHYGISKLASERIIPNYSSCVDFTILRPFNIVGTGQDSTFIVPKLVAAFAAGSRTVRLGNIDVYRDYIDIYSVCRIIIALIACRDSFGQVVNVSTGQGTSLRALIRSLEGLCGYSIEIDHGAELARKAEVWRMVGCKAKLEGLIGHALDFLPVRTVLQKMLSEEKAKHAR